MPPIIIDDKTYKKVKDAVGINLDYINNETPTDGGMFGYEKCRENVKNGIYKDYRVSLKGKKPLYMYELFMTCEPDTTYGPGTIRIGVGGRAFWDDSYDSFISLLQKWDLYKLIKTEGGKRKTRRSKKSVKKTRRRR